MKRRPSAPVRGTGVMAELGGSIADPWGTVWRPCPEECLVGPPFSTDLWPQLFSDVSCIALWISSEKILTRLYSVLHWFHKRLEANVKNPRENRCFQTVIVFSFGSSNNSNKCTLLWKIAARLITVSTSVNKEMWVKLSLFKGVTSLSRFNGCYSFSACRGQKALRPLSLRHW